MLSGTPIKNRADEFFVPLNLVSPERFPSLQNFRRRWLVQDQKGKWSRVSPHSVDLFKKEVSGFYLRREKEDVYKEIPKLNRLFTPIEITDERLKKAYNQVLDEIELTRSSQPEEIGSSLIPSVNPFKNYVKFADLLRSNLCSRLR